jgi:hypothetical protein
MCAKCKKLEVHRLRFCEQCWKAMSELERRTEMLLALLRQCAPVRSYLAKCCAQEVHHLGSISPCPCPHHWIEQELEAARIAIR